jgi:hypothetical protein
VIVYTPSVEAQGTGSRRNTQGWISRLTRGDKFDRRARVVEFIAQKSVGSCYEGTSKLDTKVIELKRPDMVIVEYQSAQQCLPSTMSGQLQYSQREEPQRSDVERMILSHRRQYRYRNLSRTWK